MLLGAGRTVTLLLGEGLVATISVVGFLPEKDVSLKGTTMLDFALKDGGKTFPDRSVLLAQVDNSFVVLAILVAHGTFKYTAQLLIFSKYYHQYTYLPGNDLSMLIQFERSKCFTMAIN